MKKVSVIAALFLCTHVCFAAFPKLSPADSAQRAAISQQQPVLESLKTPAVKQYEHQVIRRLTLREKLNFLLFRKKSDGARGNVGAAIGGFFLGLLFLPIGVLIAYLLPRNETLRKWAWIGFGAGVFLLLLFALALGSAFGWH